MIDLHTHSHYSDGVFSPSEVVQKASENNCKTLALTDHDTIAGLGEAQTKAQELGIKLINGVEISATWSNNTIHIVALNFDEKNQALNNLLNHHQNLRISRAEKMAQGLEAAGVKNAMQNTQKLVQKQMITRTHFARMLIQQGICKDMKSVFNRYLTGKKPGGVNISWSRLEEVVQTIKNTGGISIVAHPLRYRFTNTKIKRLLTDFKSCGGDGVEVICGNSSFENIELVYKWSNEIGLKQSLGSDFHGDNSYIQIGKLKELKLDNNIIDVLDSRY